MPFPSIDFFYNSSISDKFWQNRASIDREEQKKMPLMEIEAKTSWSSL